VPRGARTDTRADTAIAAACAVVALILLVLPDAPRARTAGAIRSTVVAPLVTMQQRASLARRAFNSHDSLVLIADSVLRRSQRLDEVTSENARLRALLRLGESIPWGFVAAEALVGRGRGDDNTVLLSAGARAGVQRLSAVVAAEGLVGMVQHVDAQSSVAIVWPNPELRMSATSSDGTAFGIVTAHQGAGVAGYLLEMRGVSFRTKLPIGALVVSSGLGGVYPRGIPIGTVIEELRGAAGWERSYLLRPAVRPPDVTSVLILRPGSMVAMDSVWRVAPDSTRSR
jgi:rod shape-determining protein MreC